MTTSASSQRSHNLGLIGAGDVVERFWLSTFAERPHARLITVCSAGSQSAAQVAKRIDGCDVSDNAAALLARDDVETVILATPPHTHFEIATAALAAGKNVLVEKPLCARLSETRDLISWAEKAETIFGVTFNNRHRENNAWVREKVVAGDVGPPRAINLRWMRTKGLPPEPWRSDPDRAVGGVLADLGSHLLAMGLSTLPERRWFRARARTQPMTSAPPGIDDRARAEIVIDDAVALTLETGWAVEMDSPVDFHFGVTGENSAISADDFDGPSGDGYGPLLDGFLGHVETRRQPDLNLYFDVMMLIRILYIAALRGSEIGGTFRAASG